MYLICPTNVHSDSIRTAPYQSCAGSERCNHPQRLWNSNVNRRRKKRGVLASLGDAI